MEKKKKYEFISSVKLPNIDEIIEAASDFTAPTDKKIVIGNPKNANRVISEIKKQQPFSKEQLELQKLGYAVASEEARRAKEKEMARAEELRRLCREREALAKKKEEEANGKMPPIAPVDSSSAPASEAANVPSDVAENPFDSGYKAIKKEPAEKQEFKETILEDDYKEEMDFREDTSESVDDDFMDF